jgi:hypothetical protein
MRVQRSCLVHYGPYSFISIKICGSPSDLYGFDEQRSSEQSVVLPNFAVCDW